MKILKQLLVLTAFMISSIMASAVTFSGTVESATGDILYSRMMIFNAKTYETVHSGNVCLGETPFSIEVPAGVYNVYVRAYGVGNPTELSSVDLSVNLDKKIIVDQSPVDQYIEEMTANKMFIFKGSADGFIMEVKIKDTYKPTELFVFNEFGDLTTIGNSTVEAKMLLNDNGTENDKMANDGIFTSNNLGVESGFKLERLGQIGSIYLAKYQVVIDGKITTFSYNSSLYTTIGVVNPDFKYNKPTMHSDTFYANDYIVNFVHKDYRWLNNADDEMMYEAQKLYTFYPDEFDFIVQFARNKVSTGNVHFDVQTAAKGLGKKDIDYSADYGSQGRLIGAQLFSGTSASPPLKHEILHQWSNQIGDIFSQKSGGHHGYTSIGGVHGGFNGNNLVIIDANTVEISSGVAPLGIASAGTAFSELELYLMGAISADKLPSEFYALVDAKEIGGNRFSVTRIDTITPKEIFDYYGVREPSVEKSRKSFNAAFIVLTDKPLSDAGFAFYTYLARAFDNSVDDSEYFQSFETATGDLMTMNCKLPFGLSSIENDIEGNFSVYPNPSQNDFHFSWSESDVKISSVNIYSTTGKIVATAVNGSSGFGKNLSAGAYVLVVSTNDGKEHRRLISKL